MRFDPLHKGDLMDRASLDAAFAQWRPVAVMHFAALSLVGESARDPGLYWRVNVNGALNLFEAAVAAGYENVVFSSTCATYGDQDGVILDEDTPQRPVNAYGASKLAIEEMLRNFGTAQGPTCALARFSFVTSTRAKARHNFNRSGPFLRRDLVPFYSAIDSQLRFDTHRGVPTKAAPRVRGTRVNTASRSSSFVHVP